MTRFRCPECGTERVFRAGYGDEIVSVYCLNHSGGANLHTRPVYMQVAPESVIENVTLLGRHQRRDGIPVAKGEAEIQAPRVA